MGGGGCKAPLSARWWRASQDLRGLVGLCPVWIVGQVKHGDAPRVHGQRHAEDAENVHDHAGFHLRDQRSTGEAGTGASGGASRGVRALPCL